MSYHRKIYSFYDMGWVDPPDLGWRKNGYDGNGTNISSGDFRPGVANGIAIYMDGGNEYVSLGNYPMSSWTEISIGLFSKWTSTTNARRFLSINHTPASKDGISLLTTGTQVQFNVSDPATSNTITDPTTGRNDNDWHFMVGTYDGDAQKLFVDGEQVAEATGVSFVWATANGDGWIGALKANDLEKEAIYDNVFVCDEVLTRLEQKDMYERLRRGHI